MIRLAGVRVRRGGHTVLDGLDLELPAGSVTAVMGPNGSGKTTLGHLLLGLVSPEAGTVDGLAGLRHAAVFQDDRLCPQATALRNVQLVLGGAGRAGRSGRAAADEALAEVGLDEALRRIPVRVLSGGQRRRVAIARAMAVGADLVVLDEPFTGLDVEMKSQVMAYVRRRCADATTLLITHDPLEAELFGARLVRLGGRRPQVAAQPVRG